MGPQKHTRHRHFSTGDCIPHLRDYEVCTALTQIHHRHPRPCNYQRRQRHDQPAMPLRAKLMNLRQMGAYHDIKDTNSTSASSGTGAGLALPSAQMTKDSAAACTAQKLVELPAGCDALHRHLSSQFARAEDDAASSCVGAVASILCIDAGKVQRQYDKWITHMPRIRPFFAVKANPDPVITQTLSSPTAASSLVMFSTHEARGWIG